MEQEVDVWNPDVAQLLRAASPATPRIGCGGTSVSLHSILQCLRTHFWGRSPARLNQGFSVGSYREESSPTMGVGPEGVRTEAKT